MGKAKVEVESKLVDKIGGPMDVTLRVNGEVVGQGRVPAVIRMPIGIWSASAGQHSQSLEAWFAHVPGLVVVAPATAQDNHGLLRAAIECGDPVAYFEHKELWGEVGDVHPEQPVPLGRAHVARAGNDLTIVTWSKAVHWSLAAAAELATQGVQAEGDDRCRRHEQHQEIVEMR